MTDADAAESGEVLREAFTATELSPGWYAVVSGLRRWEVIVPVGVGLAGVADEDVVRWACEELSVAGEPLAPTSDLAGLLGAHPWLLARLAERAEEDRSPGA
jgi:hypothetical protein